jgi:hypothetical protein
LYESLWQNKNLLFCAKELKKAFLNHHFEEIVQFIEEHPEKEDLWQTVFTYILGNGELGLDVVTNILKNIHSPKVRQKMNLATNKGIFGEAYRQGRAEEAIIWKTKLQNTQNELIEARIEAENAKTAAENAKIAAENAKAEVLEKARVETERAKIETEKAKIEAEKARIEAAILARIEAETNRVFLSLLHGWNRQAPPQLIADIADISLKETELWMASFNYIKTNRNAQKELAAKEWCKLLAKKKAKFFPLLEHQVTRLLEFLDKTV